jgi:hypothetical protein
MLVLDDKITGAQKLHEKFMKEMHRIENQMSNAEISESEKVLLLQYLHKTEEQVFKF